MTPDLAVLAETIWTAEGDVARLGLAARAVGKWPCPLPRFGLRFDLPAALGFVRWFGRGPGESYPDTGFAAGVGRFELTVDEMQTPYVMPQENGHRSDVRWAEITGRDGRGVRIDGDPTFGLTTRRWATERLDRAKHTIELVDEGSVFVTIDVVQHGRHRVVRAWAAASIRAVGRSTRFACLIQPLRQETSVDAGSPKPGHR